MSETTEIVRRARRPVVVARHRDAIEEVDGALGDQFIVGVPGNRRLEELHARLEQPDVRQAVEHLFDELATEPSAIRQDFRHALIEELCLRREEGLTEGARLQQLAIGAYRRARQAFVQGQGVELDLAALRALPTPAVTEALAPRTFGNPALLRHAHPQFRQRTMAAVEALLHPPRADTTWHDENGGLRITPEDAATADPEGAARDRIRAEFYRAVFVTWMSPDTLEQAEVEGHPTVLHWLQNLSATPHLYPFLQGQAPSQKAFRIAELTGKLIRLYELYARIAQAVASPHHATELTPLDTRGRLAVLSRLRYPPIRALPELTLATVACPFPAFVAFVQDLVARRDLVLPPEPRR